MAAFDSEVIMNIAICDKNSSTVEYIKNQTDGFMNETGPKSKFFIFENTVDLLACDSIFDIVFLNPDFAKISNAQIIGFIKRHNNAVAIIFVADDYSYLNEAFDLGVRRYLIKPVDKTLLSALESAIDYLNNKTAVCYLEDGGTVKRVAKSSILYLEISGRKTKIVTKNDSFISKVKMHELQKLLNPVQFASPHKSFYVNMEQITEYRRFGGQYYIWMGDNNFIPISRTKKAEFEKEYYRFLKNKKQGPNL